LQPSFPQPVFSPNNLPSQASTDSKPSSMDSDIMEDSVFDDYENESDVYIPEAVR